MFGNADGRTSGGSLAKSKDEDEKEQKIRQKFVQNRIGHIAKRLVQSEQAKEIQAVRDVY